MVLHRGKHLQVAKAMAETDAIAAGFAMLCKFIEEHQVMIDVLVQDGAGAFWCYGTAVWTVVECNKARIHG